MKTKQKFLALSNEEACILKSILFTAEGGHFDKKYEMFYLNGSSYSFNALKSLINKVRKTDTDFTPFED